MDLYGKCTDPIDGWLVKLTTITSCDVFAHHNVTLL